MATHTGRQVVEPEQFGQLVRVGLLALQGVDDLQLAVDERLAAAGEVEEGVTDALAHCGLFDSGAHGNLMDGAERLSHLSDLVPCPDSDWEQLGPDLHLLPAVQPFHDVGKALVGHLEGGSPQTPELADHRARHEKCHADGHDEDEKHSCPVEPGIAT